MISTPFPHSVSKKLLTFILSSLWVSSEFSTSLVLSIVVPQPGALLRRHFCDTLNKKVREPIIQNEVSQKDKDHYSILMHIYGI